MYGDKYNDIHNWNFKNTRGTRYDRIHILLNSFRSIFVAVRTESGGETYRKNITIAMPLYKGKVIAGFSLIKRSFSLEK